MTSHTVPIRSNRKLIVILAAITVGMIGFGFAMVPLYNLICEVTGIKTNTTRISESDVPSVIDENRFVTVEFIATSNAGMPWEFKAVTRSVKIRPGEIGNAVFYAHNKSTEQIVGQAIPMVSPGWAGEYLNKIDCFCFDEQKLEAGERKEMPVRFIVSPDLPSYVNALTLSYTFMNTDQASNQKYGGITTF